MLRRNRNKLKPFVSPTEEIDKINKLKIVRNLEIEKNKDVICSLEENRQKLKELVASFEKVEKEHEERLEKIKTEHSSVIEAIDRKNKELSDLGGKIVALKETESYLRENIPTLQERKLILDTEIAEKIADFNRDKKNSETYLRTVREKIDAKNKELNELSERLVIFKEDLKSTIERIKKENGVLSTRKKDIEILEKRFKNKYSKEKIIL